MNELIRLFLKLGFIGFGGPAAVIAMIDDEVVSRRKWLTREHFLDLVGATNLIPGPNSTEMAMHVGYEREGYQGNDRRWPLLYHSCCTHDRYPWVVVRSIRSGTRG